jgi:hypothetical protein
VITADLPIYNVDLVVTVDEAAGDLPGGWVAVADGDRAPRSPDRIEPRTPAVVGGAHAIDAARACAVGRPRACATIARHKVC